MNITNINCHNHFLIIKQNLAMGGTETLTVRMCNWLAEHGYDVTLLTENRNDMQGIELNKKINRIKSLKSFKSLLKYTNSYRFFYEYNLKKRYYIYGYSPVDFLVALSLGRHMNDPNILLGVYHPDAYNVKIKIGINMIYKYLVKGIIRKISPKNILFMNDYVKESNAKHLSKNLTDARIWPPPLNINKYYNQHSRSSTIISIGNFRGFKTYNISMLDVVKSLREKGFNVRYEIYGDGPLRHRMDRKIQQLGLRDYVKIEKQIPYSSFQEIAQKGFVFVGIGTASLEAAASGVPSVSTVAYSNFPISFGFVHQLPKYNVGEPIEGYNYINISELIEKLLCCDFATYHNIRYKDYKYVKDNYSMDALMRKFLVYSTNSEKIDFSAIKNEVTFAYLASLLDRAKEFLRIKFVRNS